MTAPAPETAAGAAKFAECDCPDRGPFRGSHCRSKRHGLPFASDDWCNHAYPVDNHNQVE
jgi:hypothetical protein